MYPAAEENRRAGFSRSYSCPERKESLETRRRVDPAGFNDDNGEAAAIIILLLESGYRVAVITTSGPRFVHVTVIGPIYVGNSSPTDADIMAG